MLLDQVQPFLLATVSLDFAEISISNMHALQPVRFGLFAGPSTIVPSLHRQRAYIFKFFTLLAPCSYATWSSTTFLGSASANCSEPLTCENFNTLIVSISLQRVRLGFFIAPSMIVPTLHRMKVCIFKLFKPLVSVSYAIWSTATFLASYSEPRTCGNFYYEHPIQHVRFWIFTSPSTIIPSLHRQKACIF